jgi:hypothetical protein
MARFESPTQMILYHVTSSENAAAIKRDGFRDTRGSYMTESEHRGVEHRGVWLSDRPLDADSGAWSDATIAVDRTKRTWINTNGKRKVRAIASG